MPRICAASAKVTWSSGRRAEHQRSRRARSAHRLGSSSPVPAMAARLVRVSPSTNAPPARSPNRPRRYSLVSSAYTSDGMTFLRANWLSLATFTPRIAGGASPGHPVGVGVAAVPAMAVRLGSERLTSSAGQRVALGHMLAASSRHMMLPSLSLNHAARPIVGIEAIPSFEVTPGMSYCSNETPLLLRSLTSASMSSTCQSCGRPDPRTRSDTP